MAQEILPISIMGQSEVADFVPGSTKIYTLKEWAKKLLKELNT